MYYFKHTKDGIEKYNVTFKKEQLEIIKYEIIKKCGVLVHREYDGTIGPDESNIFRIRNFSKKDLDIKNNQNEELYHYSYDEYLYPYLVTLIKRILKGDSKALQEIMQYNNNLEKPSIEDICFNNDKELLLIDEYYSKVRSMLSFELINTITFEEIIEADAFLSRNLFPNNKTKKKQK